jgi:DnaJ-class molecular chaperone
VESLNYYEFLAVSRSAGVEDIRAAYRRLAKQYHPDMNSGAEAVARFNYLCEAYRCLSDGGARATYDLELAARPDPEVSIEVAPVETTEEAGDDEQDDAHGPPVSPTTGRRARPGASVYVVVRTGRRLPRKRLRVTFERRDPCRRCGGWGLRHNRDAPGWSVCYACYGRGNVDARRTVTIKYRTRRVLGGQLLVPNEGNAGDNGGPRGALILNILTPDHTTTGLLLPAIVAAIVLYLIFGSLLLAPLGCDR